MSNSQDQHKLTEDPIFTILVPTCNEESTIVQFIHWCNEGINGSGLSGEILIVDSSSDNTPELASNMGARVLRTERQGLGQAYIDGLPHAQGQYLILGDADCTYDFRNLNLFISEMQRGSDFVMGSRWLGSIERNSMPVLHQYFGTPVTTWLLNRLYGSTFSDIHCGMRGITRSSFIKMNLKSKSWEYASEMVLKSVLLNLKTSEVPVNFYKDQPGRVSHHKRLGWFSPFHAGLINLRAMLTYRLDYFTLFPGLLLYLFGFLLSCILIDGPRTLFNWKLNLTAFVFGCAIQVVGATSFMIGLVMRHFYKSFFGKERKFFESFSFILNCTIALLYSAVGVIFASPFTFEYLINNNSLSSTNDVAFRFAIYGCFNFMIGFLVLLISLLFNFFDTESE